MNYVKSEQYRLVRKKELYFTFGVSLGLVIAAICALYFSLKADPNFTYATNRFLYLNVLTVAPLIILVGLLINRQLLGGDQAVIKQSISFGISRNRILVTKLGLTLVPFLFLCLIGVLIVLVGGEGLLDASTVWRTQFLIAACNLVPLIIGGFIFGYILMLLLRNEVVSVCLTLVMFSSFPSKIISLMEQSLTNKEWLSPFLPGALIEQNTSNFLAEQGIVLVENWFVGLGITMISLGIGVVLYNRKDL